MSKSQTKERIRGEIQQQLAVLEDKAERSQVLIEEAVAHNLLQTDQVVSVFISMEDEVDTTALIEYCWNNGITVCVPEFHNHESGQPIELREFQPWGELEEVRSGFFHPRGGRLIPLEDVDVIFVPGIAFTMDGDRLGRGGGFYDVMLSTFVGLCAGLCFREQIKKELPVEGHDVQLDMVLVC